MIKWIVSIIAVVSACTPFTGSRDPSSWKDSYLANPLVFDLAMNSNSFGGKSQWYPSLSTCHTQGLAVTDDSIFVSCVLYDPTAKSERSYKAEAFLVEGPLEPILKQDAKKSVWKLTKLTTMSPHAESDRISQGVFGSDPPPGAKRFTYSLGHPSGLFFDKASHRIWLATSVYGPHSLSRLYHLDTKSDRLQEIGPLVPDHIGATVLILGRFLIGFNWGSEGVLVFDTHTGAQKLLPNGQEGKVEYQDCAALEGHTFLCGGYQKIPGGLVKKSTGRLHLLKVVGKDLNSLKLQLEREIPIVLTPEAQPTVDLGLREFTYEPGIGDQERAKNFYGNYQSATVLTNNGLATSPDGKYLYFLPEDLPHSPLIRYEWIHSALKPSR